MSHYKSNLRDIEFNLFEVFQRRTAWAPARHRKIDAETAREILEEVTSARRPVWLRRRVRRGRLATRRSTRDPVTHGVTTPEAFRSPTPRPWSRASELICRATPVATTASRCCG